MASVPVYALACFASWCLRGILIGVAVLITVIRAEKEDLPAIVRALMRMGPRDDDSRKPPPSLPKP